MKTIATSPKTNVTSMTNLTKNIENLVRMSSGNCATLSKLQLLTHCLMMKGGM